MTMMGGRVVGRMIEDGQHNGWQPNAPAWFYIPYEWIEKDRAEFDDDAGDYLFDHE